MQYIHETQVAHEHVRGFVANLCFVNVVCILSLMVVCICLPSFSR